MRNAATQMTGSDTVSLPDAKQVAIALSHGLDLPLAALRVSMEALSLEMGDEVAGQDVLSGALQEVDRLGRNVRDLVDYSAPPAPLPLSCTVVEIARSARNELPSDVRLQIILAQSPEMSSLVIDGPLLARAVRRLIENAFEAGSDEVLLMVRQSSDHTTFTIVDAARGTFDPEWSKGPFRSTKPNHLGLGLPLAHRDIALLAGTLVVRRGAESGTQVIVTVPNEAAQASAVEFRDRFAAEDAK